MPKPVIPKWVSEAGLRLTVEFDFILTPQGVLNGVRLRKSSGYSDVDSAVWEALLRWKFKPVGSRDEVKGRVGYLILPR
jgi:TonB family protein